VGKPHHYDLDEPKRIAEAAEKMGLKHAVLTMVARDDLKDGGAFVVAETVRQIKNTIPDCSVEALISDLKGNHDSLRIVLESKPEILNHNLETVKRLQKALRVQAQYDRSLQILRWAWEGGAVTKSGIMVGVGETVDEIAEVMTDIRATGCEILTIGQYLPPTKAHYPLHRYYRPEEFADLKEMGFEMGFTYIESGPLVRSSYHAEEAVAVSSSYQNTSVSD
jgi:lipoic acid synthetase